MPFRVLFAWGLGAGLILVASAYASAEEQMAWTVDSYQSDIPNHADTVILTYGIPQTDAVAFEAICGGPDGYTPRVVFWYDTLDLAENQDVALSLWVGGSKEEVPAKVFGKDAEVGISGLQTELAASDPVWQAMMENDTLTYGIEGGQQQKLLLTGGADALRKFTTACHVGASSRAGDMPSTHDAMRKDSMADAGSTVATSILDRAAKSPGLPLEASSASPTATPVSCEEFGSIKSMRSDVPVQITVVNKSDGYRGLIWIDTEGTPIDNTGLNHGESATVPTFESHAWMITDGPGNCIEMFVANETDATFVATKPTPVLGPEND